MLHTALDRSMASRGSLSPPPPGAVRRRAHVARLYPNPLRAELLDRQGHSARALWNLLHEWYTWGGPSGISKRPSIAEMDRQLRDARSNPPSGWEWLGQLPAQAAQQVLKHYMRAWYRFFRGVARPPRFKKRSGPMAVDVPQASKLNIVRLNRRWGEATIPMVGRVRFRWTRPLAGVSADCPGRITGARVVKRALGWHICFRIEEPANETPLNHGPPIGIDRGVVHTMAFSDGEMLDMPHLLSPGEKRRLQALQRRAARQQLTRKRGEPWTKRQKHTYDQIAAIRARQVRRREDWLNKTTTRIAKSHGVVAVEDLNIAGMTRSARGTGEHPGVNVKAKTGLNRSILQMAWGKAERMLVYKCQANGSALVKVNAQNSSTECARCGHVSSANRLDQAIFRCVVCAYTANADTNAAQVLLRRGLTALSGATPGCGGTAREAQAAVLQREPPAQGATGRRTSIHDAAATNGGRRPRVSIAKPRYPAGRQPGDRQRGQRE
jgi:putative transposase